MDTARSHHALRSREMAGLTRLNPEATSYLHGRKDAYTLPPRDTVRSAQDTGSVAALIRLFGHLRFIQLRMACSSVQLSPASVNVAPTAYSRGLAPSPR